VEKQMTLFSHSEYVQEQKITEIYLGKPRINTPNRTQSEMRVFSTDDLVPKDHKVRLVWDFVLKLDMSEFLQEIQSTDTKAGRSATDPRLLLALWLYATLEGIGSGRVIERYCREHSAFCWLCGDIKVNYHTINDFRSTNATKLENLIIKSTAILIKEGIVELKRVSQDGMKVRAYAGSSTFRRKGTLKECLILAKTHLENLKKMKDENPAEFLNRKKAAEFRVAKQRELNVAEALKELEKLEKRTESHKKKHRKKFSQQQKKELRASTTDPEARKMKMANGGFSPAYNVQIATDTKTQIIVGLSVTNIGSDLGQLGLMYEKVCRHFNKMPLEWLVDAGYSNRKEIEKVSEINSNCKIYMPLNPRNSSKKSQSKPSESKAVEEWRKNMLTIEAQDIYKERAATSECVNANARNRGLQQFVVRGLTKVMSSMCILALTHNMIRMISL
jgi:transposase